MFKLNAVRPEVVALGVSVYLLACLNLPLWQRLFAITSSDTKGFLLCAAFMLMLLGVFTFCLTVAAFKPVYKPLLIILITVSAGVAHFMGEYGVMIDSGMFRNFAETNVQEVQGLLSVKLLTRILLLGVLPSILVWHLPVQYRRWPRELLSKCVVGAVCMVVVCGTALANYQGLSSLFRNNKELRLLVVPSNYIGASVGYLREQLAVSQKPFRKIGEDAVRLTHTATAVRKSLTVLVIGETARAQNFGVLGYARDTTPNLSRESGLLAFDNVYSCGTETAVSVPCMFSNMDRKNYDAAEARSQEGLLDVLQRAGLQVIWRDNQSGCKGACDRVIIEDVSRLKDPILCASGECRDEVLLTGLETLMSTLKEDTVLVLHQMGSHGPEYYKRYPKAFEAFTPVCQSKSLNDCSQQSIVNAYDNTVLYTDHVLSRLIGLLKNNQANVDTAMIYVSDHGESLGEYNLFLHGAPYMLAPDQQKHVPLLIWLSEGYQKKVSVDAKCLKEERGTPLSHDNLFHSMLGLLQVQTRVYRPELDLFGRCRSTLTAGSEAGAHTAALLKP